MLDYVILKRDIYQSQRLPHDPGGGSCEGAMVTGVPEVLLGPMLAT